VHAKRHTLILSASDVNSLLKLSECISSVEDGFRLLGECQIPTPKILGLHAEGGGLHIKAAVLPGNNSYFVAKANANFPQNPALRGLPTIQGVVVVVDATTGELLALIDSIELTVQRTGAATAVAAKYLARSDSKTATICGCGRQGYIQLKSLLEVLRLKRAYVYDTDFDVAQRFAANFNGEALLDVRATKNLKEVIPSSDVIVTCTPSQRFFVQTELVNRGTFIAGVGADNEHKQEIDPRLFVSSKVVVDSLDQCSTIGDLHHALEQGLVTRDSIHGELSDVVAGKKSGRVSDDEITIFDSTGVAVEDAVTAAYLYEKAIENNVGVKFHF
jgi:alanine dehydrogenase